MNKKLKAISIFEFCVVLALCSILYAFGMPKVKSNLYFATQSLKGHLEMTKSLALNDDFAMSNVAQSQYFTDRFSSIDNAKMTKYAPHSMWQMQFHLSGTYTLNSYSIYMDTARYSASTDFDSRPMSADIIPLSSGACLSGYNNTNTSNNCKNNTLASVRLHEYYGVESIEIKAQDECMERQTARIYFDNFGKVYCGKIPETLTRDFVIILHKDGMSKSVCISPQGEIKAKC